MEWLERERYRERGGGIERLGAILASITRLPDIGRNDRAANHRQQARSKKKASNDNDRNSIWLARLEIGRERPLPILQRFSNSHSRILLPVRKPPIGPWKNNLGERERENPFSLLLSSRDGLERERERERAASSRIIRTRNFTREFAVIPAEFKRHSRAALVKLLLRKFLGGMEGGREGWDTERRHASESVIKV